MAAVFVAAVLLTGCATLGARMAPGNVEKAIALINQGDADLLAQNSAVPFVFEGEVLLRSSDVAAIWRNLSINGFHLDERGVLEVGNTDDSSYHVFSGAQGMSIFFSKYIPSGSILARVESDGKEYYLLLGKVSGGYPQILGITGF